MKTLPRILLLLAVVSSISASQLRAQWLLTEGSTGVNVYSVAVLDTTVLAGTGKGMFRSTDDGSTWTAIDKGLPTGTAVTALAVSGTKIFAGAGSGVFLSTNDGTNWTAFSKGLPDTLGIFDLAVSDTDVFAGTVESGVFRSSISGMNWTAVDSGLTNTYVESLASTDTSIFAGTLMGGVFRSTNNGASWTPVNTGLTIRMVVSFAYNDTNLFAGTGDGLFLSTNNGKSWTNVSTGLPQNTTIASLAISGTQIFAGTGSGVGVFLSTDDGRTWTAVNKGLPTSPPVNSTPVNALAVMGTNIFAGTGSGLWRRPLSEMITSVNDTRSSLPSRFSLSQNYPNPFNPSTVIDYEIPTNSVVTLTVYDIIGRKIETLVDKRENAGSYSVRFNGADLPTGVYLYTLDAGKYHEARKLLLLK